MSLTYLVDTDWVIDHLNGVTAISQRLNDLSADGIGLSIISLAELFEGVAYSRNPQASQQGLDEFLGGVSLIDITPEIARIFGRERGRLRKQGQISGDFDLLIAATCLHHDLTLLTNNRKHFERIVNLKLVPVE